MNKFDRMLTYLPQSTDSWHCPWFRLIMFFCFNGVVFGAWAYIEFGAVLGIFAFVLGLVIAFLVWVEKYRRNAC